jgi:L-threonylcarbamoyladenylate synthase
MPEAVERIFSTKDRPTGHPLIIHVAHLEIAERWADLSSPAAQILATSCWPGPLTLLAERRPQVSDIVTGGRPTVGIRVPAHPLTQQLLAEHGGAIAAPSANRFGKVSPTTAQHVIDDIGEHLDPDRDLILDGGQCGVGVESTIIDITTTPAQLLRPGGISTETIAELIGDVDEVSGPSRAAGMMASHYAPQTKMVLVERGDPLPDMSSEEVYIIDCAQDLVKAAHELYSELRAADAAEVSLIVALMPPKEGLGNALRDRLTKAAADQGRGSASQVG